MMDFALDIQMLQREISNEVMAAEPGRRLGGTRGARWFELLSSTERWGQRGVVRLLQTATIPTQDVPQLLASLRREHNLTFGDDPDQLPAGLLADVLVYCVGVGEHQRAAEPVLAKMKEAWTAGLNAYLANLAQSERAETTAIPFLRALLRPPAKSLVSLSEVKVQRHLVARGGSGTNAGTLSFWVLRRPFISWQHHADAAIHRFACRGGEIEVNRVPLGELARYRIVTDPPCP